MRGPDEAGGDRGLPTAHLGRGCTRVLAVALREAPAHRLEGRVPRLGGRGWWNIGCPLFHWADKRMWNCGKAGKAGQKLGASMFRSHLPATISLYLCRVFISQTLNDPPENCRDSGHLLLVS